MMKRMNTIPCGHDEDTNENIKRFKCEGHKGHEGKDLKI
jgi:hypothetical protein